MADKNTVITIRNDRLTVAVKALGAEMTSVKTADGTERLWQGDPAWWSGQAPLLFPVAGSFKDDEYILNNKTYHMPKHGFAKYRVFDVEAQDETSVAFLLAGENARHEGFPFDYELRVRYSLEENRIKIDYAISNLGDAPMYACIGAHEAYACPDGVDNYEIAFDEDEGGYVANSLFECGCLSRKRENIALYNNALPLHAADFEGTTLTFLTLKSRGVTLRRRTGENIAHVDYAGFNYLLLWTIPGAGYICIEPWSNHPDFIDTNKQLPAKPGVIPVAAHDTATRTHTLTIY